ncbi:hypothetical protein [Sorangium sp. So ce233]|uniref:hypothetical protein n=1 Tax=Sorangium sp. So ce233 TaxID=3133290 RepID=UPI003F61C8DC
MLELRRIGYWRSTAEPLWPDPAWFVDENWASSERTRVLAYLRDGVILWVAGGHSWCRFRCGTHACGSAELSDGRFLWPEGLAHYVEGHGVRLPDEFVERALAGTPLVDFSDMARTLGPGDVSVDASWWSNQRGFRAGTSHLSPPRRGTFVARSPDVSPKPALLRLVRRLPEAQALSYPALLERLAGGGAVPVLSGVFEEPIPHEISELEAAGLLIEFLPDRGEG